MSELFSSPFFGITLSIMCFELGRWVNRKTKLTVLNPLLLAIFLCIVVIQGLGIPLESYMKGGNVISAFLGPATAVLAVSIYSQLSFLKKYWLPILVGCTVGAVTALVSIYFLSDIFGLTEKLKNSLLPKSVTTPFALEMSKNIGGIPSVTFAAVLLTGLTGAILGPPLLRLFRIKDPVVTGVALGASAHAIGTSRALELGEVHGAMSSIALCLTGLITIVISLFF